MINEVIAFNEYTTLQRDKDGKLLKGRFNNISESIESALVYIARFLLGTLSISALLGPDASRIDKAIKDTIMFYLVGTEEDYCRVAKKHIIQPENLNESSLLSSDTISKTKYNYYFGDENANHLGFYSFYRNLSLKEGLITEKKFYESVERYGDKKLVRDLAEKVLSKAKMQGPLRVGETLSISEDSIGAILSCWPVGEKPNKSVFTLSLLLIAYVENYRKSTNYRLDIPIPQHELNNWASSSYKNYFKSNVSSTIPLRDLEILRLIDNDGSNQNMVDSKNPYYPELDIKLEGSIGDCACFRGEDGRYYIKDIGYRTFSLLNDKDSQISEIFKKFKKSSF